jgi:protein-disulfide isomerase
MKIEVIETIGKRVSNLFLGNAFEALKACGINGKVVVVRDIQTILKYGIRATPALVINGVVMFAGKLPSPEEIIKLLQQNYSTFT